MLLAFGKTRAESPLVRVDRTAYLMGTRVQLTMWASTRAQGLEQLDAALRVLENAEAELSTWRDESEISALNRARQGSPWTLPAPLCGAFADLERWTRETNGAFDPAIGSLTAAWDLHGDGRVPSRAGLGEARAHSGFELLGFDKARCTIARAADVTVDAGAWGKGEALDRAEQVMGTAPWMIDLGGQVSVHGTPPGEASWRIAIADPYRRDEAYLEVGVREGSISTSAGSERDLIVNGRRLGHIIDPATGLPSAFRGSVTVWHPHALVADVLSTALYVMGPVEGIRWAEARGLAACYLIMHGGDGVEPVMTAAFRTLVLSSE